MKFKRNIFARIKSAWSYRSEPESLYELAFFFWTGSLVISFLLAVSAIVYGIEEMKTVAAAVSAPVMGAAPTSALPYTPEQLQSALDFFSTRKAGYITLSGTPAPTIPDPAK